MEKTAKIFVAGHQGLVGSAIVRRLQKEGFTNILVRSKEELDLTNEQAVKQFFTVNKPEYVFLAAAKVGGINANNTYPAEFLYENLKIQNNVLWSAYQHGVRKLLFLGSSCIYPKLAPQPLKEEYLLTGLLEPTNEPYAIAKIAGIKLMQALHKEYGLNGIAVMPTNLFGINDNFDLKNSHVLPALIRKFYEAKKRNASSVVLWGTGKPRREFLYVDDLADAVLFLMEHYNEPEIINIGTGMDLTIAELAMLIKNCIDFQGNITYDSQKLDGTPQKLLDVSKIHALGWKAQHSLEQGIRATIAWYTSNEKSIVARFP
ncbi:MAG: GDP-fucose synthetase [Candidatus Kerfeldbacteria bacterium RIFCSPHIGHO2_02_FULL_42_14]|uniref:GDP-L-fucose synthase n=1 Tax=Candidatus Kerfeldbacteria bacterium RIFCSPHIGHO2_02_FULL_42_14 TaxID=1798540 RepID=A0A1G2AQX1_9BACT|nr:MAG: GDP-fucose synthetase [Candidatus Kerfeldbacteria bacterium RIFCSPHIGHO2_02_FULL_42_14]OGY81255.1 MAG: GDP-fucose synthetase [Candidatus Kerfeldbacteria bacterium RIFCSPHIGHO2_12_FULL_42_13]OGY83530.1 MAG: GDP-fucose synthetase [Candidatus Kerfeldbacteria bacterium RIFCSPLOWO2_02_FULL_42_19]OGY85773.1 MAG: GDP-fucose synthetase [Candidatus Kerfeldbacteria bacterium RIFCSPLOWO2_12_FULL_43_9]